MSVCDCVSICVSRIFFVWFFTSFIIHVKNKKKSLVHHTSYMYECVSYLRNLNKIGKLIIEVTNGMTIG